MTEAESCTQASGKTEAANQKTIGFLSDPAQRPLQAAASNNPFKSRVKYRVHPAVTLLPGVRGVW